VEGSLERLSSQCLGRFADNLHCNLFPVKALLQTETLKRESQPKQNRKEPEPTENCSSKTKTGEKVHDYG
jgi:hypothetical protein